MKKFVIITIIICTITMLFVGYRHIANQSNEQTIKNEEISEENVEENVEEEEEIIVEPKLVNLGEFRLTAYCKCKKCCGKWSDSPTASGVEPVAKHTIAVDTKIIPFGTEIVIDGITYVAEDTGSAIKGKRIDIYMESHSEALDFGVQYKDVFKVDR